MDVWVIAAAAGAGYVAQHCKSLVKGSQSFSDSSCESPNVRLESSSTTPPFKDKQSCPCNAVHIEWQHEDVCPEREMLSRVTSMAEKISTCHSDCQNRATFGDCANCGTHFGSNLVPCFSSYEDVQGVTVCSDVDESDRDSSMLPSTRETSVSYSFARKKSSLRSKRTNGQFLKPLSSLDSCLMAQLYKRQSEVEGYTSSSITPPRTPTVGPLLLTDRSRILSRSACNSFSLPIGAVENKLHVATNSQDVRKILGVPQLPKVGSAGFHKKARTRTKMDQGGCLCNSIGVNGKHQKLQGFSHGALLFCLGMSIGLISSVLNSKQEVNNLSDMLKQTQSLVQDLQEELEMKDSLIVKELAVEDYESQGRQNDAFNNGPLHTCSPEEKLDDYHDEHNTEKAEEESFSKIEAELEAELERLELNMNSCRLDSKILNLVELDTDCVPDALEGELKDDVLARQNGAQPYPDRDGSGSGSGSSTPYSVHYAVSPKELTLRLHEVIQSRLEQRIEELEIALQNSQTKVRRVESQNASYLRELSNNRSGCSSIKGSTAMKEQSHADQPVVINLSGEALDAYNESYDEFTKLNELEEEDIPARLKDSHQQKTFQSSDENVFWVGNGIQVKPFDDKRLMFATQKEGEDDNYLSNGFVTIGDENDSGYDEMEELLIKHIVEQARKGSPVVLNAQRALSSPDENEHSQ